MKIALINDIHYGVKADALYMLDYQEKFFNEVFFPALKAQNVKTVLIGGDVFDRRKYINFRTLKRAKQMLFDTLHKEKINVHIIPGNHDCLDKNTNDVNSIELLLSDYDNIEYIDKPKTLTFLDKSIDMIPWINSENYKDTLKWIQNSKSEILYGHLELAGFDMLVGIPNEHGMSPKLFKKYKRVWSGHFHHMSQKGNILYTGAPMEFTYSDYNDPRGFHIYDCASDSLEFIRNPHTLHEKIFYNDEDEKMQKHYRKLDLSVYSDKIVKLYCVSKTKPALFDYLVDNLYKQPNIKLTILEDYSAFHGEYVDIEEIKDKSTKELIDSYIEAVETEKNKKELKTIMNKLYIEALHSIENRGVA